jgi:hypothetical protein
LLREGVAGSTAQWGVEVERFEMMTPSDFVTLSKTLSEYMKELAGRPNNSTT